MRTMKIKNFKIENFDSPQKSLIFDDFQAFIFESINQQKWKQKKQSLEWVLIGCLQ